MPINENHYSIRCQIPHHIKMSALLLKLAGDATVRGTTTHDGIQVFSALDSVNLACRKWNVWMYALQAWARLISEDSISKMTLKP